MVMSKVKAKGKSAVAMPRNWLGDRDDFEANRISMTAFVRCIKSAGKEPRDLVALSEISPDLQQKIFMHLKDTEFKNFDEFKERFMDSLLFDDMLFGKRFSENAEEVYRFLDAMVNTGVRYSEVKPVEGGAMAIQIAASEQPTTQLSKRDVLAVRLIECANHRGWLEELARVLAKDAEMSAQVDRASTFTDVCNMFDKTMKRSAARGLPLWSLSSNWRMNRVIFKNNSSWSMKVNFPKSKYAVRVVELARRKGMLDGLAKYVADKVKAAEDDDGDDDDDGLPPM
jgi:hypothetical protein